MAAMSDGGFPARLVLHGSHHNVPGRRGHLPSANLPGDARCQLVLCRCLGQVREYPLDKLPHSGTLIQFGGGNRSLPV